MLGKSRVVPRKKQAIPRLELTAARIGAKMAACVQRKLDLPLDAAVMWTDFAFVLGYITNRRIIQTIVANRVASIHELINPDQWHHVDGKLNPAYLASRGLHARNKFHLSTCISWPKFLYLAEYSWPRSHLDPPDLGNDPEVKKDVVSLVTMAQHARLNKVVTSCSSYRWLLRIVA